MTHRIFMISGPNGSGKTTTAKSLILDGKFDEFINADEIARGLAPMHPESVSVAASKLMLKRFKELLEAKKSFAFETTAAGTNYVKHLQHAQEIGYKIHVIFLWLPSPDLAIERVANRVQQGGHSIPDDTIRRRYFAGLKNLMRYYLPLGDGVLVLDNSMAEYNRVIARNYRNRGLTIEEPNIWKELQEVSYDK